MDELKEEETKLMVNVASSEYIKAARLEKMKGIEVITPVFKELGILGVIWQGVNPYKNKSNLFMEEFVSLYKKPNFLMDPDNFPDLPEDR
jgi:hypothetical protein